MIEKIPRALTIAGSDSGGGAGIQADLKTFTSHRVYGLSVLTSVTSQNTLGVYGIHDISPVFVENQIDAVANDIGFDAVKLGMLSNAAIAKSVAVKLKKYRAENLVIDPVMAAKDGSTLLKESAVEVYREYLFPQAAVVTPNIREAEILLGEQISTPDDMKNASEEIIKYGCGAVLMKGGHLENKFKAVDILYDGKNFREFSTERIKTENTHGTGCTYSAAICANLAKGLSLVESVSLAKEYITNAIKNSFRIGRGHGPLNHFWNIKD